MNNTHIIENGIVTSTIVATIAEAQQAFPTATCIEATTGSIGWTWDGETLTNPNAPTSPSVPTSITPRQGLIILSRYSLLTSVRSALDGMTGQGGEEARIDFEKAQEWKRDWPLLIAMATALGLTSAQVDQMFIEASTI